MSELNSSKMVRGRKPHPCEDCNDTIPAGTQYYRVKWLDEYGFQSAAYCLECTRLAADLFAVGVNGDEDWCYPYLAEVDWPDVKIEHPEFTERADAYLERRAANFHGRLR